MTNKTAIYKEILRDYDKLQTDAINIRNRKREKLFSLFPRLKEIDSEIGMCGIEVAKSIMLSPSEAVNGLNYLKEKQSLLNKEKNEILINNGYSSDYLEIQHNCTKCSDTGFINNEKCSCFSQKLVDAVYNKSNIKQIIKDENFENFNINYYSTKISEGESFSPKDVMARNLSICVSFANTFGKTKANENLFLYGKTGVGKTFVCNSIAKELLDKGITVMYTTAPSLFTELENERFNRSFDDDEEFQSYIEDTLGVELLIIDDLGTEFSTVFTSSQLFNIINTRVTNGLSTIISSNLDMRGLSEKYSDRITSRLIGDFTTLRFVGDDIRTLKKFYR